jgi:hypothetical protein
MKSFVFKNSLRDRILNRAIAGITQIRRHTQNHNNQYIFITNKTSMKKELRYIAPYGVIVGYLFPSKQDSN